MTTIDDLPLFGHITEAQKIERGGEGTIYRLSVDSQSFPLCAKVMNISPDDPLAKHYFSNLNNDACVNQSLYEAGISVPRPLGLFRLALPPYLIPAFVREYVEGYGYDQLPFRLRDQAVEIHALEREKAEQAGFVSFEDCSHVGNCLYTINDGKIERVTLFDFSYWRMKE